MPPSETSRSAYYSQLQEAARIRRAARRLPDAREAAVDRPSRDQRACWSPRATDVSVGARAADAREGRARSQRRHRGLQSRFSCCGCSPGRAMGHGGPHRGRVHFVGTATWSALSGRPVATDVGVRSTRCRTSGSAKRPISSSSRPRRPIYSRVPHTDSPTTCSPIQPAHRPLPVVFARRLHRDVGPRGHTGQCLDTVGAGAMSSRRRRGG